MKLSLRSSLALGGLGLIENPAGAVEPFQRRGSARLFLGLAAFSFRQYFKHNNPARRLTLFEFVDYCADQGCDGAELTAYYFPEEVTTDYLLKLKRHAFLRGIAVSGSAVGNNFAQPEGPARDEQIALVKKWADRCAVLGAPHIRVFAGPEPKDLSLAESRRLCISALEECADYAGGKGIFLGLENHGGIVAEASGLLEIVQAVKSPWLGVNLDTGNFRTDDPYADLAKCAPYAVNVQVKVHIQPRGQEKKVPADFTRLIRILCNANYQGYVVLEYESRDDPWQGVPQELKRLKHALDEVGGASRRAGL